MCYIYNVTPTIYKIELCTTTVYSYFLQLADPKHPFQTRLVLNLLYYLDCGPIFHYIYCRGLYVAHI